MSGFLSDLSFGESYQRKLLDIIEYDTVTMAEGCFKDYDVSTTLGGEQITYEVKSDRMTARTGNLAIEYQCSGKPSGITSTKADMWVHFIHGTNRVMIIECHELRRLLTQNKYKSVRGGDGFRSSMFLVPASELADYQYEY